jgi:transcriptional regulator with XRE-family HTH domain
MVIRSTLPGRDHEHDGFGGTRNVSAASVRGASIEGMAVTAGAPSAAGQLLREWRQRRRLSQFDVASRSAVSARHLSFIENGRAKPSREMVLHLAQRLEIPLRERNRLLLAAGYAPGYSEHSLGDSDLTAVREALDRLLKAHEPFPALVIDRHWNIVAHNRGVEFIVQGVASHLLSPSPNALRIALHPEGLAPRIANFEEWSAHLMGRLRREIEVAPDAELTALLEELAAYPGVDEGRREQTEVESIMLMHSLRLDDDELTLFSTVTTFGTARDITLAELTIESFFPADEETAAALTSGVGDLEAVTTAPLSLVVAADSGDA